MIEFECGSGEAAQPLRKSGSSVSLLDRKAVGRGADHAQNHALQPQVPKRQASRSRMGILVLCLASGVRPYAVDPPHV